MLTHRLGGGTQLARPTWTEFHDGFAFGEDYPKSYNSLAAKKVKAGQLLAKLQRLTHDNDAARAEVALAEVELREDH